MAFLAGSKSRIGFCVFFLKKKLKKETIHRSKAVGSEDLGFIKAVSHLLWECTLQESGLMSCYRHLLYIIVIYLHWNWNRFTLI